MHTLHNSIVVVEATTSDFVQYVLLTARNGYIEYFHSRGCYTYRNENFRIGEQEYPQIMFTLCDEDSANKFVESTSNLNLRQKLLTLDKQSYAYRDVELIAIASLCSAGNLVNKLLHTPLCRMRVARIPLMK